MPRAAPHGLCRGFHPRKGDTSWPPRTVYIASSVGLHARPTSLFVQAVNATGLDVEIGRAGEDAIDATSILGVMALSSARRGGHPRSRRRRRRGSPRQARRTALPRPRRGVTDVTDAIRGIGVSPGAAVGPVVQVRPPRPTAGLEPAAADPPLSTCASRPSSSRSLRDLEERASGMTRPPSRSSRPLPSSPATRVYRRRSASTSPLARPRRGHRRRGVCRAVRSALGGYFAEPGDMYFGSVVC